MRKSDPNASQSTLSIIGVITEFWQPTAGYVIDFKDGQSFGEWPNFRIARRKSRNA